MSKKQKISMYLLKEDVLPKSAVKKDVKLRLIGYKKIKKWKIIKESTRADKPTWVEYLGLNLKTSNASAVLFIPHQDQVKKNKEQWFAICFGYGHNFLNEDKLIDDFGLRTGLNILDRNKIKSSYIFNPLDYSKKKRTTRTVIESDLQGHDIDGYSHILKNFTGISKEEYKEISKNISATSNSLKIDTDKEVRDLKSLCSDIFGIYSKKCYEKQFPEIFYIRHVEDKQVLEKIDELLRKALEEGNGSKIYLDIPEPVDFQNIEKFRVHIKDWKKHYFEELSVEELYKCIKGKEIKPDRWEIELVYTNDNSRKIPFLKCLIFDCSYQGKEYHLSHGKWYSLSDTFSKELERVLKQHKQKKIVGKIPLKFTHEDEEEYNKALANYLKGHLFDRKCIQMTGHNKIELCDVLYEEEDKNLFIHVKRKNGSSSLSHLFQQGDVSITLLNSSDKKFLDGIKRKKPSFNNELKKVVHYLIVSKNKKDELPLFARVSLFNNIKSIRSKGADIYWSIANSA